MKPISALHENAPSTDDIVAGCRAADQQSQRWLFRLHRERVYRIICRTLSPEFDYDDVLQQVFIKVFRSMSYFQGLSSLDTWIYRITIKVCTDQLRRKYRKRRIDIAAGGSDRLDVQQYTDGKSPHTDAERRELHDKIREGLEKLEPEKRVTLTLFDIEGQSLSEIADITGTPVGTVKSRLFHARRELAKYLSKYLEP